MKLTSENVNVIFEDCLFKDGEDTSTAKIGNGILSNFGYNPDRLNVHKDDIYSMLRQLPKEFQEDGGDGMSFLNACVDEGGYQWGEHRNMEQLFSLGMAAELCSCPMPREMWNILPGGVPYYVVKKK